MPPQTLAGYVSHLEIPDLERPQAGLLLLLPQEKLRLVLLRMLNRGDPYPALHPGKTTCRQGAGGALPLRAHFFFHWTASPAPNLRFLGRVSY